MESVKFILEKKVACIRYEGMEALGKGLPLFHKYGYCLRRYKIPCLHDAAIYICDFGDYVEVTACPEWGMPKLFKIIVSSLREEGVSVAPYVYTKQSGQVKVEI